MNESKINRARHLETEGVAIPLLIKFGSTVIQINITR